MKSTPQPLPCLFLTLSLLIGSLTAPAQIAGCTDSLALNYDPGATLNDGSCLYNSATVSPVNSLDLPPALNETSGLILWDDIFWTHNDDTDNKIYALDTLDINNYSSWTLDSCVNTDWEEIAQDSAYLYIGDFGNNTNGNRTDLKILRVGKTSLLMHAPVIDTICFSYARQTDFSPAGNNNTDFDCEAFVVSADSIYLFTKEWISQKCSLYSLPKTPGVYTAHYNSQYDVQGLITGATWLEDQRIVALSGYSTLLQPFIFLLYDYQNHDFFSGNKRKLTLDLPFYQVEGIATGDGLKYFITNERFEQSFDTTGAGFHRLDLSDYLSGYLNTVPANAAAVNTGLTCKLYPNPATEVIHVEISDGCDARLIVYNALGQESGFYESSACGIDINVGRYPEGSYYYVLNLKEGGIVKGKFIVE